MVPGLKLLTSPIQVSCWSNAFDTFQFTDHEAVCELLTPLVANRFKVSAECREKHQPCWLFFLIGRWGWNWRTRNSPNLTLNMNPYIQLLIVGHLQPCSILQPKASRIPKKMLPLHWTLKLQQEFTLLKSEWQHDQKISSRGELLMVLVDGWTFTRIWCTSWWHPSLVGGGRTLEVDVCDSYNY